MTAGLLESAKMAIPFGNLAGILGTFATALLVRFVIF